MGKSYKSNWVLKIYGKTTTTTAKKKKEKKIHNEIIKRSIIDIFIGYIKIHRKITIKFYLLKKTAYGSFRQGITIRKF